MKTALFLWFAVLVPISGLAYAEGIIGRWKTIDDATGKPKSVVEIFKDGDLFKARVADLIAPDEPNPLCKECSGDKTNKPIIGLEIMWDMKETEPGAEWSKGHILDPQNGNTYKCRLKLGKDADRLEVRGYLGISLLGRTQTWLREKP